MFILEYRKTTDFCILILYPISLLKSPFHSENSKIDHPAGPRHNINFKPSHCWEQLEAMIRLKGKRRVLRLSETELGGVCRKSPWWLFCFSHSPHLPKPNASLTLAMESSMNLNSPLNCWDYSHDRYAWLCVWLLFFSLGSMVAHRQTQCWRRNWGFYIRISRKQEMNWLELYENSKPTP